MSSECIKFPSSSRIDVDQVITCVSIRIYKLLGEPHVVLAKQVFIKLVPLVVDVLLMQKNSFYASTARKTEYYAGLALNYTSKYIIITYKSYYYNSTPVAPVTQVTHVRIMWQAACSSHTHTARANAYIHRKHAHKHCIHTAHTRTCTRTYM